MDMDDFVCENVVGGAARNLDLVQSRPEPAQCHVLAFPWVEAELQGHPTASTSHLPVE